MGKRKWWSSIRWKIVVIYLLLVFIATTIIGVFLTNQLEEYYTNSIRSNIENTVNEGVIISSFVGFTELSEHSEEIQNNIKEWSTGLGQEIFVVDNALSIIAGSNQGGSTSAIDNLDCDAILMALSGEDAESYSTISMGSLRIPVMNKVFPIINEQGNTIGVLYVRADMSTVEESIVEARFIFLRAMGIALVITILLGFFIARSITEPIKDVTEKAEKMYQGDFSQEISVRSDDEIGQFAEMFNILRIKLNDTLSQISNEKNKLEAVLRHMADALIAVDLSGNIIHLNEAARKLLDVNREDDEIKESYDQLIQRVNKNLSLAKMKEECLTEAAEDVFEYAGNTYVVRYDRYKDEHSNDIGILMIIQDISERQKLENMQMDFVANVSHELKTPLTTIKSYTETLLDGAVDNPDLQKSFLGIIDTEADRMNRLVKELLQLSRMENKQEKWHKKESSLTTLLNTAVTKVEMTAASKSQQLNRLFDKNQQLRVVIDKDKIEQVLLNVLSNAIKYTQDGGRIDIDAYERDKCAHVIVSDNGIGIPEGELSRVFERFFRVDKARSRAEGGTGLGLSISKQIVEEHDGDILIESKEGKGTKVTVVLPLAPSEIRGQRIED